MSCYTFIKQIPGFVSLRAKVAALFLGLVTMLSAGQAVAALGVTMNIADTYPTQIYQGGVTAFVVTLTNSNATYPVSQVGFTNQLPAELSGIGATPKSYVCRDGSGTTVAATGTVSISGGTVTLAGGTLPLAKEGSLPGLCEIVFEVTSLVNISADKTVTAAIGANKVTGLENGSQISNPSEAPKTLQIIRTPPPTLSKSFSSNTIVKDDGVVRLTMSIKNNSSNVNIPLNEAGDTPPFALRDAFPAGLKVAPTPNAATSCGSTFAPVSGDTTITAVGGTVPVSGTCTYSVDVVADNDIGDRIDNIINRNNDDFGNKRGMTTGQASASMTIKSAVTVEKAFSKVIVSAGEESTLTLKIINSNPLKALTFASFKDDPIDGLTGSLAHGLRIQGITLASCGAGVSAAVINGTRGFEIINGTVAPNATCNITIKYIGTLASTGEAQTYVNTVAAQDFTIGGETIKSNSATHSVTVVDQMTVSKRALSDKVVPGHTVQYAITVKNHSTSPLTNIVVTDPLRDGALALSTPAPTLSGSCSNLTHTIDSTPSTPVFTIASFNAGSGVDASTCTITFTVMAPKTLTPGTKFDNIIAAGGVTAISNGTGVSNNTGSNVNTNANPDASTDGAKSEVKTAIYVGKVFNPASGPEGSISVLTITLTNHSNKPLTNVAFTDLFPTGLNDANAKLVIANPASASTTCGTGVVTAVPGSTQVSLADGQIPGGTGQSSWGTCTVQVKVTGSAGTYNNEIAVDKVTATQTNADNSTQETKNKTAAVATLTLRTALKGSKSFYPQTIATGGTSQIRLTLQNTESTGVLNNVKLLDNLPTGMTVAATPNASTTCGGSPVLTAQAGATSAGIQGVVLPAASQCDFLFDVTATGSGNWVNTIPAGGMTAEGGVRNVEPFSATLNNNSSAAVNVEQNIVSPGAASGPGAISVLTIEIENKGLIPLTGVSLSDYFTTNGLATGTASGMILASNPNLSTTCTSGVVTGAPDGKSFTMDGATLPVGAKCTITANVTALVADTITNVLPASGVKTHQGVTNADQSLANMSVAGNLGVTKEFTPAVVKPNERARLRLTFINPSNVELGNVGTTDSFPAGLVIPANANLSTTCTNATVTTTANSITVKGGTLPAAATKTSAMCYVEVDVLSADAGTYTNTIPAGSVTGGNTSNPVEASATLEVRVPAVITKRFNPETVSPGKPSRVTITINNPNVIALTKAVLTDNLPQHVYVAPTPNASTTCAAGVVNAQASASAVTLTGATLAAGGTCEMSFDVVSNIAGIYVNQIPADALTTKEGVTNEKPAEATLNLLDPPTVNKQFDPIPIPSAGKSTLTIVLGNTNKTEATLTANLVDTLPTSPGQILVHSSPNLSGTCDLANVTAAAGSKTVTYRSGAKIPAGGCTIIVDVTGTVEGSYNNYIASGELKTNAGNNVQPASANLEISPLGAITGKVFKDNNVVPNGLFELGTDVALANQEIRLTGTSVNEQGQPVSVNLTTTTDALGNYAFIGLYPGNYTVTQVAQPEGTVNGITSAGTVTGNGAQGTATAPSVVTSVISNIKLEQDGNGRVASSRENNFAEIVPSSISGTVFLDQNNNGERNSTDTAIKGVKIELLDNKGGVVATTTTDDNGNYSFKDLLPGTYSVRQPEQPADTINGKTIAGNVGNGGTKGTPSTPDVTPSIIQNIVLPPGTHTVENNFAEQPTGRQIGGRVFADYNNNGTFETDDVGLEGVEIVLTGTDINGTPVNRTTTTDANGKYVFIGLPEGTYTVTEPTQPPRTTNGITTVGTSGGTATDVSVTPSAIKTIPLTGDSLISNDNNFAEVPILTGTVSGKVYNDSNNDGIVDSNEPGIDSVTILLTGTDKDGVFHKWTTTTDASGNYTFKDVPPSDSNGYTITEIQPSLYTDGKTTVKPGNPGRTTGENVKPNDYDEIVNVVVTPGDVLTGYNYGEQGGTGATLKPPIVNGYVYMDRNHSRIRLRNDDSEGVSDWTVKLTQNGKLICEVLTDKIGFYQFDNLHCPGYEVSGLPIGSGYEISFTKDGQKRSIQPDSGDGRGQVDAFDATIRNITLNAADLVIEQNLPLDPSGVVYDALTRLPINGAVVKLVGPAGFDPATQLTTATDTQTVSTDGYYEFWLQGTYPTGVYTLQVTSPPGYLQGASNYLPACNGPLTVNATPDPGLVQASNTAPPLSVTQALDPAACVGMVPGGAQTTQYYYSFVITNGGSAQILNNHIPLDPVQQGAIMMTKTSPMVNVSRGDLVPYTITATNTLAASLPAVIIRDQIPPGFKYRTGSASVNGVATEPVVSGRLLTWPNQNFTAGEKKVVRLILTVGAGVGDGEYVNQTWSNSNVGNFILSNIATATVRVVPDPTFDCPDIIGKVFDDQNANGYQDDGEPGIPHVRVVTARGLLVTTDAEGRFHVPCPAIPNADRGSNFVMKLDTRTLPSGYRVTTENPRDVRITRGKVVKLNFGATIHRVVRVELSDDAFEAGKETLLPQWQEQLDRLTEQLREKPSVVRLGYTPGKDAPELVSKRQQAIQAAIKQRWNALNAEYTLNIETEDAQ
jgi:uncharacterized repeat protein (TIGR01451 family)